MDRRSFLKTLTGGIAIAAAERAFPFRTYFFPSDIKLVKAEEFEKIIEKLADREFELVHPNGGPSRFVGVSLSSPILLKGNIPILRGGTPLLNFEAEKRGIILTDG